MVKNKIRDIVIRGKNDFMDNGIDWMINNGSNSRFDMHHLRRLQALRSNDNVAGYIVESEVIDMICRENGYGPIDTSVMNIIHYNDALYGKPDVNNLGIIELAFLHLMPSSPNVDAKLRFAHDAFYRQHMIERYAADISPILDHIPDCMYK